MSLPWPETVLVLDPECGHELKDAPGANSKNEPHSPMGWAANEFRELEIQKKATRSQIDLMLRIWQYRHDCLHFYRAKFPHTYTEYDVYNATWVSCGYLTEQTDAAIKLCRERFTEPDGSLLDDPNLEIQKKLHAAEETPKASKVIKKKPTKKRLVKA